MCEPGTVHLYNCVCEDIHWHNAVPNLKPIMYFTLKLLFEGGWESDNCPNLVCSFCISSANKDSATLWPLLILGNIQWPVWNEVCAQCCRSIMLLGATGDAGCYIKSFLNERVKKIRKRVFCLSKELSTTAICTLKENSFCLDSLFRGFFFKAALQNSKVSFIGNLFTF